jgi:murein L,D-transpeptidase YcbB/YkuD
MLPKIIYCYMFRQKSSVNYLIVALSTLFSILIIQSCKNTHSDIGKILFTETKNKVFKEIETDAFIKVFEKTIAQQKSKLKNPKFINSIYKANDYEPLLVVKNLPDGKIKQLVAVLGQSQQHGLNPNLFQVDKINQLLAKIYDKEAITSVDEAYKTLAQLELTLANGLSNYANAMEFGLVSPRKIYAQYYTKTPRPDSASFLKVFSATDVKIFLDSVQPKSNAYKKLQQALHSQTVLPGLDAMQSTKVFEVALERLRWKNQPTEKSYVYVNIPSYNLNVIENGKSILEMKVCVGEGRKNGSSLLKEYNENNDREDRPFNRETPQLKSLIHSVQVNPIWNIPESIATNEIVKYASQDPYYLTNKGIDVYLNGNKVEDPEIIAWNASAGTKYKFKQRPGVENSLGKIKFLFDNQSSVYLHDTPAKEAFGLNNRAVSHGCVRVEKPLDLAKALFGDGRKYMEIEKEMGAENPEAKTIYLSNKKVPVYLAYQTCWVDEVGKIQYRKDVYGLDAVLYGYLQRMR